MTGTEVVKADAVEVGRVDQVKPVITAAQALAQLEELRKIRAELLKEGQDYGVIPGTGSKPSLFKPGAEKLANVFGLSVNLSVVDKIEVWEDPAFFHYTYRAEISSLLTGQLVATCEGSCNSRETKYKKRDAVNLVNTIQKMAQKRAMVGAVLIATRASEEFTQDLEDMERGEVGGKQEVEPATDKQKAYLEKLLKSRTLTKEEKSKGQAWLEKAHSKEEMSGVIDRLQKMVDERRAQRKAEKDKEKPKAEPKPDPGQEKAEQECKDLAARIEEVLDDPEWHVSGEPKRRADATYKEICKGWDTFKATNRIGLLKSVAKNLELE